MVSCNRRAKINVKVLVILLLLVVALGASLFAARHVRRRLLSKMDLNAGQAAYEKKDWATASAPLSISRSISAEIPMTSTSSGNMPNRG